MKWFTKSSTTVKVGEQLAEVLEINVKVRTPVGEFWIPQDVGDCVLRPYDSVSFTWTWKGLRTPPKTWVPV